MVMWRIPRNPCATEFFPVTASRGLATSAVTSVPIVGGAYIYQAKVVSGASVIRRWDWDTFANEVTAYTPTHRLTGTLVSILVRSVTADASHLYWVEEEKSSDPTHTYYESRVMKSDHSFGSITVLMADDTTVTTPGGGISNFVYGQLVRSPTNGDLVLAYTQRITATNHFRFDIIDSSSGVRTNIRDSTSLLFITATAWMTYTPDGALWGQDINTGNYWRMVGGTVTNLGNPFGSDFGSYVAPTPDNVILTGRVDNVSGLYVDQYTIDSSGTATIAPCDYQGVFNGLRRFVGWSPDVSTIGFGGFNSGGSNHFYRWG